MRKKLPFTALAGVLCFGFLAGTANAQTAAATTYPTKAVRLIVPFAAGGAVDLIGRQIAVALNESLDAPVTLLLNGKPIARGALLAVDENLGIRITELL